MTKEIVQVVYADDPDAHAVFTVTDKAGGALDWASPQAAVGDADYEVDAEWLDTAVPVPGAPTWMMREIKVPLDTLEPNTGGRTYTLYLQVPGGNDFKLGRVSVKTR